MSTLKRNIKRILLILLMFILYMIIFNINSVNASAGNASYPNMSETPTLYEGQSGLDIHFEDLVEYDPYAPYNCTQQGEAGQCGKSYGAHHYYSVTNKYYAHTDYTSGTTASVTDKTNKNNLEWKRYNDDTYQIGPYSVSFQGSISSVVVTTDKGTVTLNNNSTSSDGKYSVSNITNNGQFYIYIKKSEKVKKIDSVTVNVTGTVSKKVCYQYILTCYSVSPVGSGHDGYECKNGPGSVQVVEHYQHEEESTTSSDSATLPGVLGVVQLKIIKKDRYEPEILVSGAKYELWSDGKVQYRGTTNSKGEAIIEDVLIGDYTIKEVETPYNYDITGYATWNGQTFYDLTNMNVTLDDDSTMTVFNDSFIDLGGKVFKDQVIYKDQRENGYYNSTGDPPDSPLEGVTVTLYSSEPGSQPETMNTDKDGNYKFLHKSKAYKYYIKFTYNGQIYEPTTYNVGESSDSPDRKLRSYATETPSERDSFNAKFSPVDSNNTVPLWTDTTNREFLINAYTGPSGSDSIVYYDKDNTEDELLNINLGLLEREKFDFNLRKDLVNVEVRINGKEHTYDYPGGELPLEVDMRGTDVAPYEREISRSDLGYSGRNRLEVYITYVIQIQNESVGQITGYVTDLNDYYDTSYNYMESWDENNNTINWTQTSQVSRNGKTYNSMHTTSLANTGITDRKYVYIRYQLSDQTIRELFDSNKESTEENLAEIAGYRNTYTNNKTDLNGKTMTTAGETAGLIDIDSTPNNMDPVSSEVQNFIAESKTDSYQNLSAEEKTTRSREVFEDDADYAPGLRIKPGPARTISGTVFEDSPDITKLNNNERIGDGELTNEDTQRVNKVQVELICINQDTTGKWSENEDVMNWYESEDGQKVSDVTVRTGTDGTYTISGYIPGDYFIRFTYGDKECLQAVQNENQMYTGQDYKSTLYFEENYEGENNYWYAETTPRSNDATDNQSRREEVNSYSRTLQYSNATILDSDKDSSNVSTLAEKTYMYATTAGMNMEVEYTGDEKAEYDVTNVDFGVIERPRTKIILHKNVGNVRLLATDGNTIFDSGATAPGLTWISNKYKPDRELDVQGLVEGTVDEALLYGATAQISYTFTITNESEIDYNDVNYYVRGEKPADSKLNKMNVNKIIDYIPNILEYHDEYTNRTGEIIINTSGSVRDKDGNVVGSATAKAKETDKKIWDVKKTRGATLSEAEYRVSGKELLGEQVFKDVNQYIDQVVQFPSSDNYPSDITGAINSDPTKSKGILEPSGQIELKNVLTLSRVISRDEDLAGDESATNVPDENVAEIIQVTIDNGRRPYYEATRDDASGNPQTLLITETPGNANPTDKTTLLELDTSISEEVHFIVPFGQNRQLIIIIATIIGLGILVIGVIIIKKKVLLK